LLPVLLHSGAPIARALGSIQVGRPGAVMVLVLYLVRSTLSRTRTVLENGTSEIFTSPSSPMAASESTSLAASVRRMEIRVGFSLFMEPVSSSTSATSILSTARITSVVAEIAREVKHQGSFEWTLHQA